ncbi:MAG: protein kinase [Verrucomicrobiales bacterium]|nr:protein kinase [Verrucomicrobiales bacterium]
MVHRDLKLSNLFLTRLGTLKIIDFEIARGGEQDEESTAGVRGSLEYTAPDFVKEGAGFRGDEQSDIFSFGVCLYEILTGSLPFPALESSQSVGSYFQRWLSPQQPDKPSFRRPCFMVLQRAADCVRKCMAVDRAQRYRTFEEVTADFVRIQPRRVTQAKETYEFSAWIGRGGFSEVYRGRRVGDGRDVAIKRLSSSQFSSRFHREARVLRSIPHPNLVEYIDFATMEGLGSEAELYLILEFLPGMPAQSLRNRIRAAPDGLDPAETLALFQSYLGCLDHLHGHGVIHRDLKPGNLYAPAGRPVHGKVLDLGILAEADGTRTHGQVPGTLDFMPPEFAGVPGERGSPQSDLYSLGVSLYEALTGRLPFARLPSAQGAAWVEFFRRAQSPPGYRFDHPVFVECPRLVDVFRRLLASKPEVRYSSAMALREELAGLAFAPRIALPRDLPDDATTVVWSPHSPEVPTEEPPTAASSPSSPQGSKTLNPIDATPIDGSAQEDRGGLQPPRPGGSKGSRSRPKVISKARPNEAANGLEPSEVQSGAEGFGGGEPGHLVFISYASPDTGIASAVCEGLERRHVRCWMALRDVPPGALYGEVILDAIHASHVFVLILSQDSNESPQVIREVERAASKGITIVPFKIQDLELSKSLEFFISSHHWLTALPPPMEPHLGKLGERIAHLLYEGRPPPSSRRRRPPPSDSRGIFRFSDVVQDPSRFIGAAVGNYILDRHLSAGGSGLVYAGHHRTLVRPVCVKIFYPFRRELSSVVTSMTRAIRAVSSVTHPSIIEILDFGFAPILDTGTFYLVMELVDGKRLDEWNMATPADRSGFADRVRLGYALAEAMNFAHGSRYMEETGIECGGILHGDLKPGNIMVRPDKSAIILDFMLVDVVQLRGRRGSDNLNEAVTDAAREPDDEGATCFFGTPGFMSPEQSEQNTLTIRGDIYSLGRVLHGLFNGFNSPLRWSSEGVDLNSLKQELLHYLAPMCGADPRTRPDSMRAVMDSIARFASTHRISLSCHASSEKSFWSWVRSWNMHRVTRADR